MKHRGEEADKMRGLLLGKISCRYKGTNMGESDITDADGPLGIDERDQVAEAERTVSWKRSFCAVLSWGTEAA